MIDSIWVGVGALISFIVGLIIKTQFPEIDKLLALASISPLIIFILTAAMAGLKIDNPLDFPSWATAFITNVIPLLIVYVFEAAGIGFAKKYIIR
ncbi:MAG TPA: hypothetical protein VLT63_00060 [Candidatus Acidoferrum sp.]|nr:hypothetical protein [Candidatus Acidoferrum sp.]